MSTKIEIISKTVQIEFKHDKINLHEYCNESLATTLQIRIDDDGEISVFISDYDKQLRHKKFTYKEFKELLLEKMR